MEGTPFGVAAVLANCSPRRSVFGPGQFLLRDKVAMVTGAQRNIGLDMALVLAEAGATVYCIDLPPSPTDTWLKVKKYVENLPDIPGLLEGEREKGRLEYMSANVTDQKKIRDIAEGIVEREGRLDICFANAGVMGGMYCLDYDAKDVRDMMDVNVNGVFFTAQAAARQMETLGRPGSIIMTASISGHVANQGQNWAVYNSSKAGVIQMARSLACELGPKGIRVNSISPGYICTPTVDEWLNRPENSHLRTEWAEKNPLGRIGKPEELRGIVLWLASDASSFCNGSDIVIDGGHRAW